MDPVTEAVKTKFAALAPLFDERLRRRWAAVEARSIGHRLSPPPLGCRGPPLYRAEELCQRSGGCARRQRAPQAVDRPRSELGAGAGAVGRPGHPRRPDGAAACSSAARLAEHLRSAGHPVSERTQPAAARATACKPTARRWKAPSMRTAPAQFKHINRRGRAFQALRQPVVSVARKRSWLESIATGAGSGVRRGNRSGSTRFRQALGKAIPYGIYA